ncbi:hypothetical protein RUM4293_01637 [Ruegeria atlantica]|uniref:Uncharacterized protein n=1 Tax=Ruegeria atlantica TaxID=81569 RepID=A0A0N7LNL4_9RHOB|nr:hypothetical protein RUM4293_01637 [Ruegeria atlantica]
MEFLPLMACVHSITKFKLSCARTLFEKVLLITFTIYLTRSSSVRLLGTAPTAITNLFCLGSIDN